MPDTMASNSSSDEVPKLFLEGQHESMEVQKGETDFEETRLSYSSFTDLDKESPSDTDILPSKNIDGRNVEQLLNGGYGNDEYFVEPRTPLSDIILDTDVRIQPFCDMVPVDYSSDRIKYKDEHVETRSCGTESVFDSKIMACDGQNEMSSKILLQNNRSADENTGQRVDLSHKTYEPVTVKKTIRHTDRQSTKHNLVDYNDDVISKAKHPIAVSTVTASEVSTSDLGTNLIQEINERLIDERLNVDHENHNNERGLATEPKALPYGSQNSSVNKLSPAFYGHSFDQVPYLNVHLRLHKTSGMYQHQTNKPNTEVNSMDTEGKHHRCDTDTGEPAFRFHVCENSNQNCDICENSGPSEYPTICNGSEISNTKKGTTTRDCLNDKCPNDTCNESNGPPEYRDIDLFEKQSSANMCFTNCRTGSNEDKTKKGNCVTEKTDQMYNTNKAKLTSIDDRSLNITSHVDSDLHTKHNVNEGSNEHSDLDVPEVVKASEIYECLECKKVFRKRQQLRRHMVIHSEEKPYSCHICNKEFNFASNLATHMNTHTRRKTYECEICNKHFSQSSSLRRHKVLHTGKKPYMCEVCGKEYSQMYYLNIHHRTHSESLPFKCELCERAFARADVLRRHVLIHTWSKPYTCSICSKTFKLQNYLDAHLKVHKDTFKCSTCSKEFTQLNLLKQHEMSHSKQRPYKCPFCSKAYTRLGCLRVHLRSHTDAVCNTSSIKVTAIKPNNDRNSNSDTRINKVSSNCSFCDQTFCQLDDLLTHITVHLDEVPYQCDICGRAFNHQNSLEKHRDIHAEEPFRCDVCVKTFYQKHEILQHKRLHMVDNLYDCKVCGKPFCVCGTMQEMTYQCDICHVVLTSSRNLQRHLQTHTTEKYQCNICNKGFKNPSRLKRHLETHNNKSYKCESCQRAFVSEGRLLKHEKVHTESQQYTCDKCCKKFYRYESLVVHEYSHTDNYPLLCETCGKGFVYKSAWKVHTRKHTSGK